MKLKIVCVTESRIRFKITKVNVKKEEVYSFCRDFQKVLFHAGKSKAITIQANIDSKSIIMLFQNSEDKNFLLECLQTYSIYLHEKNSDNNISSMLNLFAQKAKNTESSISQLVVEQLIQKTIKESKLLDLQLSYTLIKRGPIGVLSEILKHTTGSSFSTEVLVNTVLFGFPGATKVIARHLSASIGVPAFGLLV